MKQKAPSFNGVFLCSGGGTRTPDLVVNSHSLYPVFIKKVDKTKNTETQNRPNTAMKSPGEPTPFLFYIITPKMERQYLTVDSSIRQDKSG